MDTRACMLTQIYTGSHTHACMQTLRREARILVMQGRAHYLQVLQLLLLEGVDHLLQLVGDAAGIH